MSTGSWARLHPGTRSASSTVCTRCWAAIIRPGYRDGHWTKASWTDQGLRDKVGATHWPLPELLHAFLDAGLEFERFGEGGAPTPTVLGIRARKVRT
jgi:hypothetical protein